MSARENLIAARALIADPKNWTQGEFARDDMKRRADPMSPDAKCFCSMGAVAKVVGHIRTCTEIDLLIEASWKMGSQGPIALNDNGYHAVVLKMFDLAIERAPS